MAEVKGYFFICYVFIVTAQNQILSPKDPKCPFDIILNITTNLFGNSTKFTIEPVNQTSSHFEIISDFLMRIKGARNQYALNKSLCSIIGKGISILLTKIGKHEKKNSDECQYKYNGTCECCITLTIRNSEMDLRSCDSNAKCSSEIWFWNEEAKNRSISSKQRQTYSFQGKKRVKVFTDKHLEAELREISYYFTQARDSDATAAQKKKPIPSTEPHQLDTIMRTSDSKSKKANVSIEIPDQSPRSIVLDSSMDDHTTYLCNISGNKKSIIDLTGLPPNMHENITSGLMKITRKAFGNNLKNAQFAVMEETEMNEDYVKRNIEFFNIHIQSNDTKRKCRNNKCILCFKEDFNFTEKIQQANHENFSDTVKNLHAGDLYQIMLYLKNNINNAGAKQMNVAIFFQLISSMLAQQNSKNLEILKTVKNVDTMDTVRIMETFTQKHFLAALPMNKTQILKRNNQYVFLEKVPFKRHSLLGMSLQKDEKVSVKVRLQTENFKVIPNINTTGISWSVVVSKNLPGMWENRTTKSRNKYISNIITICTKPHLQELIKPIEIEFHHLYKGYEITDRFCVFWNFTLTANKGNWSTSGCNTTFYDNSLTVCTCNHLSSFALLMDVYESDKKNIWDEALMNWMTVYGCTISIFGALLTIISYVIVWRYVALTPVNYSKSILLISLCFSLIVADTLMFVASITKLNREWCTVIGLLMHYFYLVVFFNMLMEGVDLLIAVKFVFWPHPRVVWFLMMAWVFPMIIVTVSAGVTKLTGYGRNNRCWLSSDDGFLWAFCGPAILVITLNLLFMIIVLQSMLTTSEMIKKDVTERITSGIRAVFLLMPIFGLTWLFAILAIDEKTVFFQYLFVGVNSLQGLFICIIHCFLSRQVREGICMWYKKRSRVSDQSQSHAYSKNTKNHARHGCSLATINTGAEEMNEASQHRHSTDLLVSEIQKTFFILK